MLVVKIELWPLGNEANAQPLGLATISNDATGSPAIGNYTVRIFKGKKYSRAEGVWRTGRVLGFPRQQLGPWDLLYRALLATVKDRNP